MEIVGIASLLFKHFTVTIPMLLSPLVTFSDDYQIEYDTSYMPRMYAEKPDRLTFRTIFSLLQFLSKTWIQVNLYFPKMCD